VRLPHQPGRKPIPIIVADANVMFSRLVCAELKRRSEFDLVGCAAPWANCSNCSNAAKPR